jgi:hypothetical protein
MCLYHWGQAPLLSELIAGSQQEAKQLYTKAFYQTQLNCHEYSLDYQLARGNMM